MVKLFSRGFQSIARNIVMPNLDYHEPCLYKGKDSLMSVPLLLKEKEISSVLIVSGNHTSKTNQVQKFLAKLDENAIRYLLFTDVEPNPSVHTCEKIGQIYLEENLEAMVGVGGGSVIDATKLAGIYTNSPNKDLEDYIGMLKVKNDLPFTVFAPTTAGTGSEVTSVAVFSIPEKRAKKTVIDMKLIPDVAVLDPLLTVTLPQEITAGTGMDVLTHAVEAYVSQTRTVKSIEDSKEAVKMVSENLLEAYHNPENIKARENMLYASYLAGRAFSRAYVGYVHALSHALSAFYGLPHGQTNATLLPIVLQMYSDSVYEKLSELAIIIGVGKRENSDEINANHFIHWIISLNEKLNINDKITVIKDEDITPMAKHANKEANPLYPVPKLFSKKDLEMAYLYVRGDRITKAV